MSRKRVVKKEGWNWEAFLKSFVWYYKKGMSNQATLMLILVVGSLGLGLIPITVYCGLRGNRDFYDHIKQSSFIL